MSYKTEKELKDEKWDWLEWQVRQDRKNPDPATVMERAVRQAELDALRSPRSIRPAVPAIAPPLPPSAYESIFYGVFDDDQ